MNKKLKTIELQLDDYSSIDFISLVEFPAIEEDFMKFHKDKISVTMARINSDQRIIVGPAMIPLKEIYRYNEQTNEEYNVYFSIDTVKKVSQQFLMNNKLKSVNLDHDIPVNNVTLIESWIVEDAKNDKANALGYDVPAGTWMTSFYVDDEKLWGDIKNGKYSGFSIEGAFIQNFESQACLIDEDQILIDQIKDLMNHVIT